MAKNKLRKLRIKAGLTQLQLAEKAGTSQQQIQRIEAGSQEARLSLAAGIAAALGVTVANVFPAAARPLSRVLETAGKEVRDPHFLLQTVEGEKVLVELGEGGIDADPMIWSMRFWLRNGYCGVLTLSGSDKRWIESTLCDESTKSFIVFQSGEYTYAIGCKHLSLYQFVSDREFPGSELSEPGILEADNNHPADALVYLNSSKEPIIFSLSEGEEEEASALQDLFFDLDLASSKDPLGMINFADEDDEQVFVRADDIAMLAVKLTAMDPAMAIARMDSIDEDDEANG